MMKMRAPEGLTGFSHQGHPLEIADDGAVHVDVRHRSDLEAHGFTPWDGPASAAPAMAAAAQRALDEKRTRLVGLFAETIASMPEDDIDRMLADADERQRIEREDADRVDPDKVTATDIETMKRHELFAFLKKRNVRVVPPVDNETLRTKARAALTPAEAA